jgi:hypothetical protein
MLWSDQANFYTNPLKSETNDVPASTIKQLLVPNDGLASTIEQLSVPNDGPASTIKQLSVPNDSPAHFKQLSVPKTAPQAFSATTATTTTIKTPVPMTTTLVPMTTTATMKAILLKFDGYLLHPADSYSGKVSQITKELFFSRLLQMTKYFVMRECEVTPTWISLCCDSAFAHKKEFLF